MKKTVDNAEGTACSVHRKCRICTSSADVSVSSVSAQTDPGREHFRS